MLWIEAVTPIYSIGGCSSNGGEFQRNIILEKENMNGTKIVCLSREPGSSLEEKVTWKFNNKSEIARCDSQKNEDVCTKFATMISESLKIDPIRHTLQSAIYYCEHKPPKSSRVCTVEVKGPKQPDETPTSTPRSSTGPTITYDTSSTTSNVKTDILNETPSLVSASPTNSTRLSKK